METILCLIDAIDRSLGVFLEKQRLKKEVEKGRDLYLDKPWSTPDNAIFTLVSKLERIEDLAVKEAFVDREVKNLFTSLKELEREAVEKTTFIKEIEGRRARLKIKNGEIKKIMEEEDDEST